MLVHSTLYVLVILRKCLLSWDFMYQHTEMLGPFYSQFTTRNCTEVCLFSVDAVIISFASNGSKYLGMNATIVVGQQVLGRTEESVVQPLGNYKMPIVEIQLRIVLALLSSALA